jgi:hypothetical protein
VEVKPTQSFPVDLDGSEGASFELRDGEDRCLGSFWVFRTGMDNVAFTFAQDLVLAPEVRHARLAHGRKPLSLDILEPLPGRFRPWSPETKAYLFKPGGEADGKASSGERLGPKTILDAFAFLDAVPSTQPDKAPQERGASRRGGRQHPGRGRHQHPGRGRHQPVGRSGRPAGAALANQRKPNESANGLNPHAAPFIYSPGTAESPVS